MGAWALDLGTTNSGLATWDADARKPRFVELAHLCRNPAGADPMEAPRLVPSATHLQKPTGVLGRLGTWGLFRKRLWGTHGLIGRPALDLNLGQARREYAPTFKGALMRSPYKLLAHLGQTPFTARDVARVYIRELVRAAAAATGERPRDLVVTTPVDAYETYRAELLGVARDLGLGKLRFLDEPVAAAIGYGLGVGGGRTVLVVDMGGGTAHAAVVQLDRVGMEKGTCRVLGKAGRQLGGNLVDRWLAEEFCKRLDYPLRPNADDQDTRFWWQLIVDEARRVKEAVFFAEKDAFYLTPPEDMRAFEARIRGDANLLEVTLDNVREVLSARGYYDDITRMVEDALGQAQKVDRDLSDVLLVGGSTLLPDVYARFEARFGRDKVRAWQPFEAIAFGAAVYAAGELTQSDVIVHDYAFVTHDPATNDRRHTVVIPRGTRVPTAPEVWCRQLVPTCALGEPERFFKLVICEIGQAEPAERRFAWDESGQLHKLGGKQPAGAPAVPDQVVQIVVPLNDKNPTLGELEPPHQPGDRTPRLEVAFAVSAERWLTATVRDLKTGRVLMDEKPVVRLV